MLTKLFIDDEVVVKPIADNGDVLPFIRGKVISFIEATANLQHIYRIKMVDGSVISVAASMVEKATDA